MLGQGASPHTVVSRKLGYGCRAAYECSLQYSLEARSEDPTWRRTEDRVAAHSPHLRRPRRSRWYMFEADLAMEFPRPSRRLAIPMGRVTMHLRSAEADTCLQEKARPRCAA